MSMALWIGVSAFLIFLWLLKLDINLCPYHPDALKLSPTRWTEQEIRKVYEQARNHQLGNIRSLPPKKSRRYIITGGGGLVGGWIMKQLLERGESPSAIRILDLTPPTRSDLSAAIIGFCERAKELLLPYYKVNVNGTENVLAAAKTAGASIFVITSSGSVAIIIPRFFVAPWKRWPDGFVQLLKDATVPLYTVHDDFLMNYCVTKAEAERLVLVANNVKGEFLTGAIRPCNAIYGSGTNTSSSLTVDCLKRQGGPSWLHKTIQSFACAENIALAHLNYEHALLDLSAAPSVPGRAYFITDPNPPISFGDFYQGMASLSKTRFVSRPIRPMPLVVLAIFVEAYELLRCRYMRFLPVTPGDLRNVQPSMFVVSYRNIVASNEQAGRAPRDGGIGYKSTVTTMQGVAKSVLKWNEQH